MTIKVHYRITQDRAGLPQDYAGARHVAASEGQSVEDAVRRELAADYQIPLSAVQIVSIES